MGPLLIARDHVRSCVGEYSEAWAGLNETLRRLETLKLVRYQIMAYDILGYMLLDLNLCAEAAGILERGLRVASEADIRFWKPRLQANLAVARVRLGRLDLQSELERALGLAQANREGWLLTRCLEGLAELALASGKTARCAAYADQLLRVAENGKLREIMARAHRWRGEALLADKAYSLAESELHRAAELSEQVGRLRLSWDVHSTLARLLREDGQTDEAMRHQRKADRIAARITSNLRGSELKAAAPLACE